MPALTPEQEALKQAALAATQGKWSWWTSNSYLRLSSERGGDGDILHGARLSDGCCTVTISEANRAFIERANPAAILALFAQLKAAQADTDKLLGIIYRAYQIAGAHDAPAHILDVLSDPEAATAEQVDAMLPYQPGLVQAVPEHIKYRWNIEPQSDGSILICENDHEKGEKCEYLRYVPSTHQPVQAVPDVLRGIATKMRRAGASIPAPENRGTAESAIATGLSIGLLLVEDEIDKCAAMPSEPAQ